MICPRFASCQISCAVFVETILRTGIARFADEQQIFAIEHIMEDHVLPFGLLSEAFAYSYREDVMGKACRVRLAAWA